MLINKATNKFIGIDKDSGCYPYDTDNLGSATIWYNKESAKGYTNLFQNKDFRLHKILINKEPESF